MNRAVWLLALGVACGDDEKKNEPCYSPIRLSGDPASPIPEGEGCNCDTGSYCVQDVAVVCSEGGWRQGVDGPCSIAEPGSIASCQELGGVESQAPCPRGFHSRTSPERRCCLPIQVSAAECRQVDYALEPASASADLLATTCPDGHALRAFIREDPADLCCER